MTDGTSPEPMDGLEIVDRHGDKVGRVRQVYTIDGKPAWAGVRGNLLASTEVLVPLEGSTRTGDVLEVAIDRERVRAAPRRDPDTPIAAGEAERMRGFYGLPATPPAALEEPHPVTAAAAADTVQDTVEEAEGSVEDDAPAAPAAEEEGSPAWSLWDPVEEARYARSMHGVGLLERGARPDGHEDEVEPMANAKWTPTTQTARAPRSLYELETQADTGVTTAIGAPDVQPVAAPAAADLDAYFHDEVDDAPEQELGAWDLPAAADAEEAAAPQQELGAWDLADEDDDEPMPTAGAAWDLAADEDDDEQDVPAAVQVQVQEQAPEPVAAVAPPAPQPAVPADTDLTLSEERLHAGTEAVPQTRVRLTKVVVTEERTITVQVRREELRIVREPITDGAPVADYEPVDDDETTLVLHEERVVVTKEFVPVERIRLVREAVAEDRTVSEPVRKEHLTFGG